MNVAHPIESFIAALRAARVRHADEPSLLDEVRALAVALAQQKSAWLTAAMCRPDPEQGFGLHLLHEEDDHTLAAFVVTWLPGRKTPPHDHGTWAVIAGLEGAERNWLWHRADDGERPGHADVRPIGDSVMSAGDVIALPTGAIHSVANEGADMSVSLHVYGRHVNHTERSQFDPDAQTQSFYKVRVGA